MDQKGGEYQNFPSKIFCLKVPKKIVGEPFSVSLISGIEFFYASEGYITISLRIFWSRSTETFVEEPFCAVFQKIPFREKFMDKRGGASTFSVEDFLSHSAENFRTGTPNYFTNFGCRKMLGINRKNFWQGSDSNPEPTA